ncbi:uncharacterized protein LOC119832900 [Zerene cesonia]|uniref:uncharacterized protein LOC119832900 n=1 Tax=Zerene cesonia TaxID=33412 RepID=UPI0018E569AE|nr:uncharacterized protein LOC119832900 [Zerene cesonia]
MHCLKMASLVVFFLIFHVASGDQNLRRDSVIDHLTNGMKFAQDFLGSESIAMKVADFVVRAFQPKKNPTSQRKHPAYDDNPSTSSLHSGENYSQDKEHSYDVNESSNLLSPWRHLVKLLGLQTNQISAVAVNALIFIAQMITTFLSGPKHPNRQQRSDDLTTWMLNKNSKKLQELLATAKNESLPDLLEDLIRDQESEDISCIQLLVCKITPFVNKMQKAVFGNEEIVNNEYGGPSALYRHLPSREEFNSKSQFCEKRFKECNLNE